MNDILVINMNEPVGECCICGQDCTLDYSVGYCCGPTHDEIGSWSTEYRDTIVGGWCACKECHDDFYGIKPLEQPKLHKEYWSKVC